MAGKASRAGIVINYLFSRPEYVAVPRELVGIFVGVQFKGGSEFLRRSIKGEGKSRSEAAIKQKVFRTP